MNLEQLYEQAQQQIAQNRHDDAYKILKKLDLAVSDHPGILYFLGVCQSKSGNKINATKTYRKVLELMPSFVEAMNNLGLDLKALGDLEESLLYFQKAVDLRPDFFEAKLNLASLFLDLHMQAEALETLSSLLQSQPMHPLVLSNLGRAYLRANDYESASKQFVKAAEISPNDPEIHKGLVEALKASKEWVSLSSIAEEFVEKNPSCISAKGMLHEVAIHQCNWSRLKQLETEFLALPPADFKKLELKPFSILCRFANGRKQLGFISSYNTSENRQTRKKPNRIDRMNYRVAYISADFREHPVSYLSTGIFQSHNREKFDIFAVAIDPNPPQDDFYRNRIKASTSSFYEAGHLSDQAVIKLLNDLDLDILIDLTGHTKGARPGVLRARCAPIQIQFLGFPGTTGSPWMDYTIGDPIVSPESAFRFYSEKLIVLPDCFQPNQREKRFAPRGSLNEFGLPEDRFIFACFNQSMKITQEVFETWMRILKKVPDSILWLAGENELQISSMLDFAKMQGVEPDRLFFAERIPYEQHLNRYTWVDLVLDTFPFNGGTTTSDALWQGAPVITCLGEVYASRMAASLLHNAGLDELITDSQTVYESVAVDFASNKSKLDVIRQKLHKNLSTGSAFSIKQFTQQLEKGLELAIKRSRSGLKPDHILVPNIPV